MERKKLPEFDKVSFADRVRGCDYEDYKSKYDLLLWYEEIHSAIEMRHHDLKSVHLAPFRYDVEGQTYCQLALKIENLSKGAIPIVGGDIFVLKPCDLFEEEKYEVTSIRRLKSGLPTFLTIENLRSGQMFKLPYPKGGSSQDHSSSITSKRTHRGLELCPRRGDLIHIADSQFYLEQAYKIIKISRDTAILKERQPLGTTYPNQIELHKFAKYDVYPFSQGIPFIRCRQALTGTEPFLKAILCNPMTVTVSTELLVDSSHNDTEVLRASLAKLNEYQQVAVLNIMAAHCRPFPYIIFGPPGTGKTRTIIEAIIQIHGRNRETKILVCANSNACADHLFEKVMASGYVEGKYVHRFELVESYSPLEPDERPPPPDSAVIIVSTNIASAGLPLSMKFDYIFLDEAGHCYDPEALVPWNRIKQGGCMILAGDPYQLGPVVQSQIAEKGGLDKSILDYFFALPHYQKTHNAYNNKFITKLNISYRCDPRLLVTSNKLFYDNELICRGQTPDWLAKRLTVVKPIVAVNSKQRAVRPPWSTSWCNQAEVDNLIHCLEDLFEIGIEPKQIGIISFYALQRDDIKQALKKLRRKRFEETLKEEKFCTAATVDAFQGEERDIIIISTVRNPNNNGSTQGLQFLNDLRRFNVAVSRARWLVIIIGDLELLDASSHWSMYLEGADKIEGRY